LTLKNYQCNRQDRNASGGGVLTYIRKELHPEPYYELQLDFNKRGLEVTIDLIKTAKQLSGLIIIIGVYRPPNAKQEWFNLFSQLISVLLLHGNLILLGDLNCNMLQENAYNTKKLLNIVEHGQLKIAQASPTRITSDSASCLDLIAINRNFSFLTYRV